MRGHVNLDSEERARFPFDDKIIEGCASSMSTNGALEWVHSSLSSY